MLRFLCKSSNWRYVVVVLSAGVLAGLCGWAVAQPWLGPGLLGGQLGSCVPQFSQLTWIAIGVGLSLALWLGYGALLCRRGGLATDEVLRRDALTFLPAVLFLPLPLVPTHNWLVNYCPFLIALAVALFLFLKAATWSLHREQAAPCNCWLRLTWVAAGLYAIAFSTMVILQCRALNVMYFDCANFEEMMWRTLHGEFMWCTIFPHSFLGEHIQLTWLLLLPVYALLPRLETLAVAATVALALGAVAVHWIAAEKLKSERAGFVFALCYLLYPAMEYVNLEARPHVFRPISFAIPLVLFAFHYLTKRKPVHYWVFAALMVLCREDLALILVMFGIYAAIRQRQRVTGLVSVGIGLAWFAVCVWVIVPHFRGESTYVLTYYDHLGKTPAEMVQTVLRHPLRTLSMHLTHSRAVFLLHLLIPFGLLALCDCTLLLAIPPLVYCLLSHREALFSVTFHYHAIIVPIAVIASVYGLANVAKRLRRRIPEGEKARSALLLYVLSASVVCHLIFAKSPLTPRFYDGTSGSSYAQLYRMHPRVRLFHEAKSLVPGDATVRVSDFLAPHFTHHPKCYVFPGWYMVTPRSLRALREDGVAASVCEKLESVIERRFFKDGEFENRLAELLTPDELAEHQPAILDRSAFPRGCNRADYVVVDRRERWFREHLPRLRRLERSGDYEKLFDQADFVVLRRKKSSERRS